MSERDWADDVAFSIMLRYAPSLEQNLTRVAATGLIADIAAALRTGKPKKPASRERKYPWHEMEIGDSFFVPNKKRVVMQIQGLQIAHTIFKKTGQRPHYAFRDSEKDGVAGVRVWRES